MLFAPGANPGRPEAYRRPSCTSGRAASAIGLFPQHQGHAWCWNGLVAGTVIRWLDGLFDDVTMRIRPGITWTATAAAVPLTVRVRPADHPTMSLPLDGEKPSDLRSFAAALQQALNPLLGTNTPPCPTLEAALEAIAAAGQVSRRCKEGDFSCAVAEMFIARNAENVHTKFTTL